MKAVDFSAKSALISPNRRFSARRAPDHAPFRKNRPMPTLVCVPIMLEFPAPGDAPARAQSPGAGNAPDQGFPDQGLAGAIDAALSDAALAKQKGADIVEYRIDAVFEGAAADFEGGDETDAYTVQERVNFIANGHDFKPTKDFYYRQANKKKPELNIVWFIGEDEEPGITVDTHFKNLTRRDGGEMRILEGLEGLTNVTGEPGN